MKRDESTTPATQTQLRAGTYDVKCQEVPCITLNRYLFNLLIAPHEHQKAKPRGSPSVRLLVSKTRDLGIFYMKSKEQLMKLDKTITFWKGFASGFATAVIGVAGLVALINYLVQITQAVKS